MIITGGYVNGKKQSYKIQERKKGGKERDARRYLRLILQEKEVSSVEVTADGLQMDDSGSA